jgi:hypothetical protein
MQTTRALIASAGLPRHIFLVLTAAVLTSPFPALAQPVCSLDPTRTIFAGGPGAGQIGGACRQFDGNQASCTGAFAQGRAGIESCFYDTTTNQCKGCGFTNEGLQCTNTCIPSPKCPKDRSRSIFAGSDCGQLDEQPTSCAKAFQRGQNGSFDSCFVTFECLPCGNDEAPDVTGSTQLSDFGPFCTNTCVPPPTCLDSSRTMFVGPRGTQACQHFDGDQTSCLQSFELERDGTPATCFFDSQLNDCFGCSQSSEANGKCTNTCVPPPSCPLDSSRTIFAGGPDTEACHQFDGDQTSCVKAFHRGDSGIASCFYNATNNECLGCGPSNESRGKCTNSCAPPPSCPLDSSRTIFAGGPGTEACHQFDDDQTSCVIAFHRGDDGIASCFFDATNNQCRGCGSSNEGSGQCTNTCASPPSCPQDDSRTFVANCSQFDGNQAACLQAFSGERQSGFLSCFFSAGNDQCGECDFFAENNGDCTNSCAPPPTCLDSSRTVLANCGSLSDADPAACNRAFEASPNGPIDCVAIPRCIDCDAGEESAGMCMNTCGIGVPTETNLGSCFDGIDNDGNGLTDCADPACRGTAACGGNVPTMSRYGLIACILILAAVGIYGLRTQRFFR